MKHVAYCPIDLSPIHIDELLLADLVNKHDTGHHDGLWKCLPLIGRVDSQSDFKSARMFELAWEKRYNAYGLISYNQAVYSDLKPLYDHLEQLPLTITHAQILNQIANVGKHYDLKHDISGKVYYQDYPGVNEDLEPAGYKVLLNNFDTDSFYIAEGFGKPNHYIKLPKDTNTFVINENTYPHGATLTKTPKYIVSIFGLINKEKHHQLVQDSLQKYSNYSITF